MSESVRVAAQIEKIITAIRDEGKRSQELIEAKALSTMRYRQARAQAAVKAKAQGIAVTMIKHHAEGEASKEEYQMIVDTEALKAHWTRMENLRSQLNGYQSINRFLAVT